MTTTKQLNISNLLDLWKNATQPFKTFNEDEYIGFCFIKNSQWPNKIWLKQTHSTNILNDVSLLLKSGLDNLTFSYFDEDSEKVNLIFDYYGFNQVSYQYGMSLNLKELNPFEIKTTLNSLNCKFCFTKNISKSLTFNIYFIYRRSECKSSKIGCS